MFSEKRRETKLVEQYVGIPQYVDVKLVIKSQTFRFPVTSLVKVKMTRKESTCYFHCTG